MINYYEELKIDKTVGIDDIQKELSRLESTWKRREITNPEKAAKMIALLVEARKVFSNSASRTKYDRELNSNKPIDNDFEKDRYMEFDKWRTQAFSYYNECQYDLAKTAIDMALSYSDEDDDTLYCLVADIYREAGNNNAALDYINRAIVLSPERSSYYLCKGLIYIELSNESLKYDQNKAREYENLTKDMFQTTISKAKSDGDKDTLANALGALAYILYFKNPIDKKQAIIFAKQAEEIGGDPWGNSKRVLDAVTEERNSKKEDEEKKLQAIREAINKKCSSGFLQQKLNELDSYQWEFVTIDSELRKNIQTKIERAKERDEETERLQDEMKNVEKMIKKTVSTWDSLLFNIVVFVILIGVEIIVVLIAPSASFAFMVILGIIGGIFYRKRDEMALKIAEAMYKERYDRLRTQLDEIKNE